MSYIRTEVEPWMVKDPTESCVYIGTFCDFPGCSAYTDAERDMGVRKNSSHRDEHFCPQHRPRPKA